MVKVLFVCYGNICRSPMAEAVFIDLVRKAQLADVIEIDSAGTGDWHVGEPAHRETLRVLTRRGIAYDGRARQITRQDLELFDYVIVMDSENRAAVEGMTRGAARAHIAGLLDYAPDVGVKEVPDPYYSGRFEQVYALVLAGAQGLLAAIRHEHGL